MDCVFLAADMMFSSRVLEAAKAIDLPLKIVPIAADLSWHLTERCRLLIIDLTMPGLNLGEAVRLAQTQSPAARLVAFGPHVDEAALSAAAAAGCQVLTRGQFHQSYAALLASAKSPA
jgi:DNA-binding NarL/FixJ family response regulator